MKRGTVMEKEPTEKNKNPLGKSEREKENEFIDVFSYFETANIRNRDAFCELLDYTVKNKRDSYK
jgi:hypothetical protein